jgi:hypothetical protein
MPRPQLTLGKDPVPIVQEAGWASGPVWTSVENLAPPGFGPPPPFLLFFCFVFVFVAGKAQGQSQRSRLKIRMLSSVLPGNFSEYYISYDPLWYILSC